MFNFRQRLILDAKIPPINTPQDRAQTTPPRSPRVTHADKPAHPPVAGSAPSALETETTLIVPQQFRRISQQETVEVGSASCYAFLVHLFSVICFLSCHDVTDQLPISDLGSSF